MQSVSEQTFFLTTAANLIGVAPITLKRWLLEGKINDVQRDRRGWRVFTQSDINRIKAHTEYAKQPAPKQLSLYTKHGEAVYEEKASSFRDSAFNGNKKLPFHRWVPWIAGFSSNFVEDCFNNYLDRSVPHSEITILDPFAGVGTTLTEGIMHGYNVVGFEINPYAYLSCKVKLSAVHLSSTIIEDECAKFLSYYNKRVDDQSYTPRSKPPEKFGTRAPFYSPDVARKVLIVMDYLPNINNLEVRDIFRLAFGSVMVSFSNYSYEPSLGRRVSSGKEEILDAPVESILAAKITNMSSDMYEFEELHADSARSVKSHIFNESIFNATQFCEPESIDLIVTSPPYLNNYHYLRNTRPQLYWLDIATDPKRLREIEHESFGKFWQTVRDQDQISLDFRHEGIESRLDLLRDINQDKKTYGGAGWANYAATYFNDTYRFCQSISKLMKPDSKAVVVIGNSILQGVEINTDQIFADIGEIAGLKKIDIILLRTKRTGSSIIDSSVRAAKTTKKTTLYEAAVVFSK